MSAKMPWFRLYWQVLNYHKLTSIAAELDEEPLIVFGAWLALLCVAGRGDPGPDGGRLLITSGRPATPAVLAREIGLEKVRLTRIMDLLVEYGSLVEDDGVWQVKNWGDYQKASDYSTPRVRRWRAKQQAKEAKAPRPAPLDKLPASSPKVRDLMAHFEKATGITPPPTGAAHAWTKDWLKPTADLLELAGGDLAQAQSNMDAVIDLMRKKGLKMTRPGSLVNVTRRWLGEQAWSLVCDEIGRVGYDGRPDLVEELDRAIRQAGGWQYVCTAPAEQAAERFTRAYLGGLS